MTQLTEDTFEQTLQAFIRSEQIDLSGVSFIDPYGMLGLLEIGELCMLEDVRKTVILPRSDEVLRYLERMDFFTYAKRYYALDPSAPEQPEKYQRSPDSDVLLEITPIERSNDIHLIVGNVRDRAQAILATHLRYDDRAINGFIVALSEVCQNIIEHAEAPGWVAAQSYNWTKRLGRQVVVIAVSDLGRGFKGSLTDEHSGRFGDRWGDVTALEAAFIHGLTRFPDSGRGQGIQQIRKQVGRWGGLLSIRSGTARIADTPEWSEMPPVEEGLTYFPGAQINIILPERLSDG